MLAFAELNKVLRSYQALPLFHKLFVSTRYFIVPWRKIVREVENSGRLLDFGMGHGLLLTLLRNENPNLECYGYEDDLNKVAAIRNSLNQKNIKIISQEELERIKKSSFDYVTVIDVLYCVPPEDWRDILEKVYRLLGPGGKFIMKETVNRPKWKYWWCLVQEYLALKVFRYTKGSKPRLFSPDFYLNSLENAGFKIERHSPIDKGYLWPHYLFIARKE